MIIFAGETDQEGTQSYFSSNHGRDHEKITDKHVRFDSEGAGVGKGTGKSYAETRRLLVERSKRKGEKEENQSADRRSLLR